jgi:flavin reductase (DIM6/NTAB) family NADH-FMN oxidoreductase RutF
MLKDIGAVMALYPTPTTLVGTVLADGRVNFLPIAHVGIVEHDQFLISMNQGHKLDVEAIRKNGVVSVSLVSPDMVQAVDWCGIAKAENTDKSRVFPWHFDELEKAPVVENAPVCMTCRVTQVLTFGHNDDFILQPVHTYVQEEDLDAGQKIDYEKISPVLFEFQHAQYLATGKVIAGCWEAGKEYGK